MQTAVVDYIFEQLGENSLFFRGTDNELNISISASDYLDLKRLAKEMFKKSIIDAANITKEDRWYRADKYANCGEKYYDKYYGSKGSDEPNGKKVLSALKEFRDSLTDEEKENMFKGSDETNVNNVEEVPNVSNAREINWGGVVQHIPNICNCHQSNCHLINGKYICASCNKTLNVETQPIAPTQIEISEPDPQLIESMSYRYRHDFGLLQDDEKNVIRTIMKQLWEEVVGKGFYKQAEISDEEIKEAAKDYHRNNGVYYGQEKTFIDAIKWYREQLKKKQ